MNLRILFFLLFASSTAGAQIYSFYTLTTDEPEHVNDFSSPAKAGWPNVKWDAAINAGYYYADGKYNMEGKQGISVYRDYSNKANSGLSGNFIPFASGYNKYLETEFKLGSDYDTSVRYGLFFGLIDRSGYEFLIRPDGRFLVAEVFYDADKRKSNSRRVIDYQFSEAVNKGTNGGNKLRVEIEYERDEKYLYQFYINDQLVHSHTAAQISPEGATVQFIKRGSNYKLEVDNLAFGTYRNKLKAYYFVHGTPLSLPDASHLGRIMMDQSLDIGRSKTDLLAACEPYTNKFSEIETEIECGTNKYQLSVKFPSKNSASTSFIVSGFKTLGEMQAFEAAFLRGVGAHGSVREFSEKYKVLDDYRYPFYTRGNAETKRGVVSFGYEVKLTNNTLNIRIDYNKKSFIPITVTRGNDEFHRQVRDILGIAYDFEDYRGSLIETSNNPFPFRAATEFYKYTGPGISLVTSQLYVRKTGSYVSADRYDLGTCLYNGSGSKAREEYANWISYIKFSLGKDYVIVPLTSGSNVSQMVTGANRQSIAFRHKDLKDSRYIKLILEDDKLYLYFSTTDLSEDIDNDSFEQIY